MWKLIVTQVVSGTILRKRRLRVESGDNTRHEPLAPGPRLHALDRWHQIQVAIICLPSHRPLKSYSCVVSEINSKSLGTFHE